MKFCDERIQKHLLNGGRIKRNDDNAVFIINRDKRLSCGCLLNSAYILTENDLIYEGWKIVEPEYDWDKIIKDKILCQFWDEQEYTDTPIIGYLTKKNSRGISWKWMVLYLEAL